MDLILFALAIVVFVAGLIGTFQFIVERDGDGVLVGIAVMVVAGLIAGDLGESLIDPASTTAIAQLDR